MENGPDACNPDQDPLAVYCKYAGATADAVINNGKGGYISVTTSATPKIAFAFDFYAFLLVGPKSSSVPVIISGTSSTAGTGTGTYFITGGNQQTDLVDQDFGTVAGCKGDTNSCKQSGAFTLTTSLASNNIFGVDIIATTSGADSEAMIDPTITIDPSFPDASQYSIVADAGIFTPSPEPTTAALTGLTLSLLAVPLASVSRRRNLARKTSDIPQYSV